ncbi:MAG: AsmA-like C-terminal region-containing protein [Hyphomicrobiaceae bacterium]
MLGICLRGVLAIMVIVLPVAALAAGLLYLRLLSGPISVSFLVEPIQNVLNEEMPGVQFRIEDAIVQLNARGAVELRLTSVRVTEDTGSLVALASRASVQLSLRALRSGRIAAARIDLLQPRVVLFAADRPSYMLGYGRDLQGRTLTMPAPPARTSGATAPRETEIAKTVTIMRDRIDVARRVAEITGEIRRRKGAASFLETFGLKEASLIVSDDRQQAVLRLPSLELSLRHKSQRSVIAGAGTMAGAGAPFKYRFRMEDSERRDRLTMNVEVEDLIPRRLALGHAGFELFEGIELPVAGRGTIEFSRQGDVIAGTFDVSLGAGRVHLPWLGKVPLDTAGGEIKASYEGAERRLVIAPSTLRWRQSHATLQGQVAPAVGHDGAAGWRFEVHGVDGLLTADDLGAPPLPLSTLIVRGTAFPATGHIEVSEFQMTAGEAKVAMVGTVAASGSERIARLDGRIGPMSLDALKTMWPQSLAPQTRKWVASHIVTGRLRGGAFSVTNERRDRIDPRDPAAFRERALSVALEGENIGLEYLKGLPLLEAREARLTVEGTDATFKVPAGIIKATPTQHLQIHESTFTVSGVDQGHPQARLDVRLAGPAGALADLLARPPLKVMRNSWLDGTEFDGKLDARFSATFPMHDGLSVQDVQIVEGRATITEGHALKVMGRYNVSGAAIRAEARANAIEVAGEALLDGVLAKLGWRYPLVGAAHGEAQGLRLRATLGNSERAQLGIHLGDLVNGDVDVDLSVRPGDESHAVRVTADLSAAEIQLSELAWVKPPGQRAELKFDIGKRRDGNIVLQNFRLDGDTIGVSGWVALGADNRAVEYLFTDFSLNTVSSLTVRGVLRPDRVWEIKANGARFDARDIFRGFLSVGAHPRPDGSVPPQSLGVDLEAKVDTVTGVPDVYVPANPDPRLRGVQLRFSSRNNQVREIDLSARHDNGKALRASMKPAPGAPRIFTVDAEDTGEALKLIGIYRSMRGGEGRLEINIDGAGAAERRGTMRVRRFRVIGDPVVSDMASAYSDDGQPAIKHSARTQQVVREQIEFERLRASFATGNGQLVIEDMEVVGPILGATLRGKLDYRTEQVHLGGTYTPLSGLNRALSGVPLFGEVLTGPRREGIVAMTFAIQGPMANPQFIPNPLSLMTPGFLREIFQMAPNNPTVTPGRPPSQVRRPTQPRTTASPPATGPAPTQQTSRAPSPGPDASKAAQTSRARAKVATPEITDGWAATTDPRTGTPVRN